MGDGEHEDRPARRAPAPRPRIAPDAAPTPRPRRAALRYPRAVRSLALLLVAATVPLTGCVSTDPSIFVAPTISSPAVTVESSALGTGITSGGFSLDLHLGPRAAGSSTVTLGEFSILDATMTTPIVPTLDVTSTTTFPVTVAPGSDVTASFTFGGTATLMPPAPMELCASAGVVIGGTVDDSLAGKQTPMYSDVFQVSGCSP